MRSTTEVLEHHLSSFGAGDLDGLLSDYAEGAVLVTADGPRTTTEQIRAFFVGLIAEFGKPGATFEMLAQHVQGEVAFILWRAETADNVYPFATDTFVVRDGSIAYQTFAAQLTPKA